MKGLYIHIPFCAQKCGYCNFVITLDRRQEFRSRFLSALEREMTEAARRHGRLAFDTFYIGGGTPSLLSADEMSKLFSMTANFFEVKPEAEITCEFNPGDAGETKVRAFKNLGINRVSLGAQAFQDSLIKNTGRSHSVQDIFTTVEYLKSAGISNISLDLISGLPGQTLRDFRESLENVIQLGAKQLSYYDLEIHENTPWGIEHQKNGLKLLSDEARSAFFQTAVDLMTAAGYVQYEISTFAKPGFESKHNLIYWRNEEYLGLGPGAYSYLNGIRSQFAPDTGRYLFKCESGDWKPDTADLLTPEEKEVETLITGLRLPGGVDLSGFPLIRAKIEPRVKMLEEEKLVLQQGSQLRLTDSGKALVESVFKFLVANRGQD